ncbi:hypothetical protein E8E13_008635 [Curvularia kusanoi]|uniref:Uncharacterized protein n=1 Tax=Curvularia kusanoi TaxID=90978 RepID=A0A9P4TJK5_CURKU|nr:hypothetical protein E8E13_008635 [Curvularia kusanoi]
MASALPTAATGSAASTAPAPAPLGHFRDTNKMDSDASDSDQSDGSRRSLSPTRQGLSKNKKRKERRQFGAFADELGDLLGSAFQNKEESKPAGVAASTHAADGDLDMQVEPTSSGPKMSKRQRQNLAKMQARKLAKEKSKMVTAEEQTVAAERRGMTIQEYKGGKPPPEKKSGKSETKTRRSRKERQRLKKKAEQADAMDIE